MSCHSVVAKQEDSCYVCGDIVPKETKAVVKRRPASALTNTVFLATLALMAHRFFAEHRLSLPVTLAISCTLLLVRIVAERLANRNSN